MKVNEWLAKASRKLEESGIGTARLDVLILLEDATGKDRAWLLAHPDFDVRGPTSHKLEEWVERRAKHEPLAYIRGKTEFYGREFIINKHVLEPRPESETMIDLLKQIIGDSVKGKAYRVVDIGTGSGALAITAKLEIPEVEVIATDIDPKCLQVARQNAQKHQTKIKFLRGNLLEPLQTLPTLPTGQAGGRQATPYTLHAILANLPYVPDDYKINQAAAMEPRQAIFGGQDGLDLYRQIFDQLNRGSGRVQFVFTESLPFQHKALESIAKAADYKLQKTDDFIQVYKRF